MKKMSDSGCNEGPNSLTEYEIGFSDGKAAGRRELRKELEEELKIDTNVPYAVVTFHPVTLENNSSRNQIESLLEVCKSYENMNFIFTKANADAEGRIINLLIDEYASKNNNIMAYTSLGTVKYLSALKYCSVVIGNSSSGLLEAPSFGIPTVNIGDRQRGRIKASSVIDCEPTQGSIKQAIDLALSVEFKNKAKKTINPYGNGNTSEKVIDVIKRFLLSDKVDLKKRFYDYKIN